MQPPSLPEQDFDEVRSQDVTFPKIRLSRNPPASSAIVHNIEELMIDARNQRDIYLACASIYYRYSAYFDVPGTITILISTLIVAIWPENFGQTEKKIIVTCFNMIGLGLTQLGNYMKVKDKAVAFESAAHPLEDVVARLKFAIQSQKYTSDNELDTIVTEVESDFRVVLRTAPRIDATLLKGAFKVLENPSVKGGSAGNTSFIRQQPGTRNSHGTDIGAMTSHQHPVAAEEDHLNTVEPTQPSEIEWKVSLPGVFLDGDALISQSRAASRATSVPSSTLDYIDSERTLQQSRASSAQTVDRDLRSLASSTLDCIDSGRTLQQSRASSAQTFDRDLRSLANIAPDSALRVVQPEVRDLAEDVAADANDVAHATNQLVTDSGQSIQRDERSSVEVAVAKDTVHTGHQITTDFAQSIQQDVRSSVEVAVGKDMAHTRQQSVTDCAQSIQRGVQKSIEFASADREDMARTMNVFSVDSALWFQRNMCSSLEHAVGANEKFDFARQTSW